jgi:citrate synthase
MNRPAATSTELQADGIRTAIWDEEAEPDNPFVAVRSYCRGYDVFGELLGAISSSDYLYLLLRGELPAPASSTTLQILAVALANPGPRDPSVHAAMAAGVGGSTAASMLMAALAVGAGSQGGAREVFDAMACLQGSAPPPRPTDIWPEPAATPGFSDQARQCPLPVRQTLARLTALLPEGRTADLHVRREALEAERGAPLALTGVVAAALTDLGFSAEEGEMLYLLLRLPGAAAHALEQKRQGFRHFPFFSQIVEDDPDARTNPDHSDNLVANPGEAQP